jgi:hypothetical protein
MLSAASIAKGAGLYNDNVSLAEDQYTGGWLIEKTDYPESD